MATRVCLMMQRELRDAKISSDLFRSKCSGKLSGKDSSTVTPFTDVLHSRDTSWLFSEITMLEGQHYTLFGHIHLRILVYYVANI